MNYIIPRFVLDDLPLGLAGLFIAAVMAAAMPRSPASSTRCRRRRSSTSTGGGTSRRRRDAHYLTVSQGRDGVLGTVRLRRGHLRGTLGSLIEVVNRFGSFFYGSILGVFLLAMIPRARAPGAFVGLIAGMTAVAPVRLRRAERLVPVAQRDRRGDGGRRRWVIEWF